VSFSYVLAFMEYCPHVGCKYTSNFTHHSITNPKVLTIFTIVVGLWSFLRFWIKLFRTVIRRNAPASIVETMCYFNRKIGLPDLAIASFRVAINLYFITTICYSMYTAVRNSSFSKLLALLQSFLPRITLKAEQRVKLAGKGEMFNFFRLAYTKA